MSLLNDGEAAGAGLVADVVPEDVDPAVGAGLAEDVDLAEGAVPVGGADLVADADLEEADSDEVRNH